MSADDQKFTMNFPVFQFAFGGKNRFAARDYNQFPPSEPLANRMQFKDELAISDEDEFKERFGFDAPLEQRRNLIDLQRYWDFTNSEITKLKTSGCMVLSKGKATSLCASRLIYAMGHVYLLCCVLLGFLSYLTLLAVCHSKSYQSIGEALILLCVVLLMLWFSSRVSFEPVGMLRKRGFKLGQQWVLPKTAETSP